MKKILGLDLGTNSIGWSLIERNFEKKKENTLGEGKIIGMGSRIIPMSQDVLDKFGQGQSHSQTAERTGYRGVRRLYQRDNLRRERLHRILNILGFLPEHYADKIDFDDRKGQFINNAEVKLNYKEIEPKKFEFIFKDSFNEMVQEFKKAGQETKIPYDWTIYYLRKKSIQEKISLQELAWILLNFNQKRGYYQLRGEEVEVDNTKLVEFHALKVVSVKSEDSNKKNEIWYSVELENGWIYRRKSKNPLDDWIGKIKEFIVTTPLDENGEPKKDKEGNINRSFRAPKEDDWTLVKTKTQNHIEEYNSKNNTIGISNYVFSALLKNPKQKINGKLVKTIERHFYKNELIAILEKQKEFHSELKDEVLLENCITELYPNNYAQQNILKQKDFTNLFVNDIIFYQRPLKSKKSLIDGCKFESRVYKNKDGELETKAIKVIHKSHPLYQEFRLWQFVENIRILQREKNIDGKVSIDYDVTPEFINNIDEKVKLFKFFNDKEKIKQNLFLGQYKTEFGKKLTDKDYRWNYVENKEYPLNETRALFISKLNKHKDFDWKSYLTQENEIKLWHLLYSISDKKEIEAALDNENSKLGFPFEIRQKFKKVKPFKNEYGAYSEKAIKKLLPLMRIGKYWKYDNIDINTKDRIQKIINSEYDEKIQNRVREKSINLNTENDFTALPLWLASYVIYDRHSESDDSAQWKTPAQLEKFIKEFKQHSLRNPIVEQVVTETLRVVKDIWQHYGESKENFFDEIHVELGRDMKNPADKRKQMTESINKNQNTNQRIRILLREFKNQNIESVIPESPNQQEKLRVFEDDVLSQYSEKDLEKEIQDGVNISKVIKSIDPTSNEIAKYKLWLEQKYRSPYTGQVIPLSKLFTTEYEIEHILPQARYFDNSLGNKIICESEVNRFKDRQTAFEMISKNPGYSIELDQNKRVSLFTIEAYQNFVLQNFQRGSKKQKILLSEDIPDNFISRQLTDTRYISKIVKGLLSNIVREDDEHEVTSKNVVSVTGSVTSVLKQDWGLNDKWNEIIQSRFERMNKLVTKDGDELSTAFGYFDKKVVNGKKTGKEFFRNNVPIELKKDFNKKRIDHRHHAMDALVVALASRNHVNYLSNQHAKSKNSRYDLRNKLRRIDEKTYKGENRKYAKEFLLPWLSFPLDAKNSLENIVVSFKQNLRVINKATNRYQVKKKGKTEIKTQKGINWAIRKPMHKETVYAKVNLIQKIETIDLIIAINKDYVFVDDKIRNLISDAKRKGLSKTEIIETFQKLDGITEKSKLKKVKVFSKISAARPKKNIDESFNFNKIKSITDVSIQKILVNHLEKYNETNEKGETVERSDLAFSEVGLVEMNKNIKELNGGKNHQPIYKARVYEILGNKFAVGQIGNRKDKYVEAAKGTNLFFAIYKGENKKGEIVRQYDTIPLNVVIERLKQGDSPVPEKYYDKDEHVYDLLFTLSPNDLVYVPTEEEQENINPINLTNMSVKQKGRIYLFTDGSGTTANFIPYRTASLLFNCNLKKQKEIGIGFVIQNEYGVGSTQSKNQKSIDNIMIKEYCRKLKVNRLGKILKVGEY